MGFRPAPSALPPTVPQYADESNPFRRLHFKHVFCRWVR